MTIEKSLDMACNDIFRAKPDELSPHLQFRAYLEDMGIIGFDFEIRQMVEHIYGVELENRVGPQNWKRPQARKKEVS